MVVQHQFGKSIHIHRNIRSRLIDRCRNNNKNSYITLAVLSYTRVQRWNKEMYFLSSPIYLASQPFLNQFIALKLDQSIRSVPYVPIHSIPFRFGSVRFHFFSQNFGFDHWSRNCTVRHALHEYYLPTVLHIQFNVKYFRFSTWPVWNLFKQNN